MWLLRKEAVKLVRTAKNRWSSDRDGHVTGNTANVQGLLVTVALKADYD